MLLAFSFSGINLRAVLGIPTHIPRFLASVELVACFPPIIHYAESIQKSKLSTRDWSRSFAEPPFLSHEQ